MRVVHHGSSPAFKGMTKIGTPIFDLSMVAKLDHGSTAYQLVKKVQRQAEGKRLAVHILPAERIHISIVNPIFSMDPPFPEPAEQERLFAVFKEACSQAPIERLFAAPFDLCFGSFYVDKNRVQLVSEHDEEYARLTAVQTELKDHLQAVDPRFDSAGGKMPRLLTTVCYYQARFSEQDHAALGSILAAAAEQNAQPVTARITAQQLRAVRFDQLFMPWIKEASVMPG